MPPRKRKAEISDNEGAAVLPMTPKNMRVVELRETLTAYGLSPKGLKSELVGRLEEFLEGKVGGGKDTEEANAKEVNTKRVGVEEDDAERATVGGNIHTEKADTEKVNMGENVDIEDGSDKANAGVSHETPQKTLHKTVVTSSPSRRHRKGKVAAPEEENVDYSVEMEETLVLAEISTVTQMEHTESTKSHQADASPTKLRQIDALPTELRQTDALLTKAHQTGVPSTESHRIDGPPAGPQPIDGLPTKLHQTDTLTTEPLAESHRPTSGQSASCVVYISNFVRPFTVPAVKDLVEQFGVVVDFWMNNLRTCCYAHYASVAAADECVRKLAGLKWPFETGKSLQTSFSDLETMTLAKEEAHKSRTTNVDPSPIILDKLFMKTEATPHLYYLPAVSLE